jgi:hypothetical protein
MTKYCLSFCFLWKKRFLRADFVIFALIFSVFLVSDILAQSQATTAKQVISKGKQCSSTGVGIGMNNNDAKNMAEKNRVFAESKARKKGKYSFTNKSGGGVAVCEKTAETVSFNNTRTYLLIKSTSLGYLSTLMTYPNRYFIF